ncbi:adenylate/guanylate cyclase domain-containing protein [bacterium]|nr:adenylate/guanylate cyclase domain-containing protein [bacterium]
MLNIREYLAKVSKTKMAVFIALLVATLFSVLDYLDFAEVYENKMLDFRYKMMDTVAPGPEDKIVIVAIDDQTLSSLKVRWPWPRSIYAKAIDNLSKAGARVVAFDLIFSEPSDEEKRKQDKILGDAIVRSRAWIVLGSKFYAKKTTAGLETSYVAPIPNIDPGKTHVGYVNYWADKDGIVRHAALVRKHQGKLYQSFTLKILSRYYKIKKPMVTLTKRILNYGPMKINVERNANMRINFRGARGHFRTISFDNIVDDDIFQGLMDAGVFKDKIILIGPLFTEAQDDHATPFFHYVEENQKGVISSTPGVEIHANALNTIMEEDYFSVIPGWAATILYYLMALVLSLICVRMKPIKGFVVLLGAVFMYGMAASWVFTQFRFIVPMLIPMFMVNVGTYFGALVYLLVVEERQSRFIKGMFSRYVSPKVVDQLVRDPNAELKLGGTRQLVTVLFADVRGFTTMSEQLSAEEVVELLNEYFQTWTDIIFKHDGTVDKFIGDAVMAIFGAPVAHADDARRALRAALDMREALAGLQEKWKSEGKRSFNIGVGLNTGEAIVGNIGSQQAMGYTVIGDTVNVAARLESKTKDFGAFLLISESTYAAVKDIAEVKEHQGVTVKGKAAAFSVYEVLGLKA